ncbi:protein-tyrosine phosphatase-like protein [Exophiala viscosa]|uniref:Protein-tyrosine phosphatase-like protein n=1 Tax=Exophiala viscosa TaxID=2486360 RepID=A0AAN6DSG1_9EURO|nr:protein-tyrosine phosphatase-like protein [Exophiala viscosa]
MLTLATPKTRHSRHGSLTNSIDKVFASTSRLLIASPTTFTKMASPEKVPSTTTAPLIPDKIFPNLYISDIHTARAVLSPNYPAPNRPVIRYILSVIDSADRQPKVSRGDESKFVLKFINLRDVPTIDLLVVLQDACDFIKSSLANNDGGVLVHCQKGVSRSASVLIGFVMEEMDWDYDTALRYVRAGRSKIRPNSGFEKQLQLWHKLRYSIYEADGKTHKEEYVIWKCNNEEQIKSLGIKAADQRKEDNKKS